MKKIAFITSLLANCSILFSQNKKVVRGGCEGCELYKEGMPKSVNWQTKMAVGEKGEALTISGFIFKNDGKTPAANVILYIYHTDNDGLYKASANQNQAKRHGRLRGWMKTDSTGRYEFTTIKPATYPNTKFLAHIHPTIKESDKNEYYIDDFVFEDDPNMNDKEKKNMQYRGGNGIVKLSKNKEGVLIGTRNIILGLNIPNYK
jgi:protocatechuate 3,4-dioxygenase, beta subunit